jgi:hypothetical protein
LLRRVDERKAPKSAITVAVALERWLGVVGVEETTRDRYEDLIRRYILPTFGDMQLARIDPELLERFYARLHRCRHLCPNRPPKGHVHQPLSTSTTRKIHYIIRAPSNVRSAGIPRRQPGRDGVRADAGEGQAGPADRRGGSGAAQRGLAGPGVGACCCG